jgi:hypothetical protein
MVGEIEIKGVAIRTFFEVMRDRIGPHVERALRQELPEAQRNALHEPVLASSWYPIAIYRELHLAAQRMLKTGHELSRQIGRDGVSRDFQGIYKMLAGAISPHWLMSWGPRMYTRYFRGGSLEVPEARSGFGRAEWRNCAGFDRNLWLDMIGSVEATLEACRATHVRYRLLEGGGDGDTHAIVEFRWV